MTEYVGYLIGPAFIALLLISAAAVLLLLSSRFGPTPVVNKIEASTKLITAVTALISLVISAVGVAVPLKPAAKDEAQSALELYMDSIRTKHFQTAYDILSEARKEEKRRELQMPGWGLKEFSELFVGTRASENLGVEFVHASGGDRIYRASYDVYDETPHSVVFGSRKQQFSSKTFDDIFIRGAFLSWIINNLKEYYIVSDESIPKIKDYINSRTLGALMDPIFISVMVSDLERGGLKLTPIANPNRPDSDLIKRHFFHDAIVMTNKEDGRWKIRSGLAAVIAVYP